MELSVSIKNYGYKDCPICCLFVVCVFVYLFTYLFVCLQAVKKVGNVIENGVELFYSSPDGEEGFPGKLDVIVIFRLVGTKLQILYEARTNKPTVISLTHHPYFNLNGHRNWGLGNITGSTNRK